MDLAKNSGLICLISLVFLFIACDNRSLKNYGQGLCKVEKGLCNCNSVATVSSDAPTSFPEVRGILIQQGKIKLVIVEFFHPLCSPCRASVKHLNEINKRNDVEVIAVSIASEESLKKFIDELKPEYQIWNVSKDFFKEMGIEYVPHAFIYRASDKKILWNNHPSEITDELLDDLGTK